MWSAVGCGDFLDRLAMVSGLERVNERTADTETGREAKPGQHLAREAGHARQFWAQPHGRYGVADQRPFVICSPLFLGRRIWPHTLFLSGIDGVAHSAALPSERVMRTRVCFLAEPKRSSAAPNSRSTIM